MVKNVAVLLCFIALLSACADDSKVVLAAANAEKVTIYRDAYGTPQVFAASNYGVYFGYGYAVAEDRLFQMEMLKRTAKGEVAAVLGEQYLALDIKLRTEYNQPLVAAQVASLPARDHDILAGYAAGFNARIDALAANHDIALPKPFIDYNFKPSRWTATDVALIFVGSIAHRYADFNSERDNLDFLKAMESRHGKAVAWRLFNGVKWLLDSDSPTTVARGDEIDATAPQRPLYLDHLPAISGMPRLAFNADGYFDGLTSDAELGAAHKQLIAERGFYAHNEFSPASNYWAMSDLSDAKGALLNGPQFGFSMPGYVYGIGLHGGDFDVVGSTLLALPGLLFAHNNELAWGSTAGISDLTDEFYLQLNPENPEQYWHSNNWVDFERWSEVITVRDGEPVMVTARRSVQGMVLDYKPNAGYAWARARTWEGKSLDSLMAWVWLATDRDLAAAERRISRIATNINMYTMDKRGRLGYVHSGRYPQRAPGHDSRLPATGDGSADWLGLRPYADNPKTREPAQGYVVNWNNRPSADWISSDLWPYTWAAADRAWLLINAVESVKGGTVDDMVAINRTSTFADVNRALLLPRLNAALAKQALTATQVEALTTLNAWDGQWQAGDAGFFAAAPTIMEAWVSALQSAVIADDVGEDYYYLFAATNYPSKTQGASIGNPVGVKVLLHTIAQLEAGGWVDYDFFNGVEPAQIFASSFRAAVASLTTAQGDNVLAWRTAAAPMQWLPVNFRGVPQASPENVVSVPSYQNRGSENNVFVATGQGIIGKDVIPPGQGGHLMSSGQPAPHYDDQLALYNTFNYKPMAFTNADVKAAAVGTTELVIGVTRD